MQRTPAASVKCVLVGNSAVGKTSLIDAYTKKRFNDNYVPTTFDNYSGTVNVDKKQIQIDLSDTSGDPEFDSLRPLSFAEANVFLLCFKVTDNASWNSLTDHWLPEIRAVAPHVPVILVGTQEDLRWCHYAPREVVDPKRVRKFAEKQNVDFIECSALTKKNLKELFDRAIMKGLENTAQRFQPPPLQTTKKPLVYAPPVEKSRPSLKDGFRRIIRKIL
ncbi:Rho-related GTP-binding protein RhoU [Aphelenchoides fujianensis]|nr:Rho-related GTP-binding protein RhoU [Aphelenchoides fujianensis]